MSGAPSQGVSLRVADMPTYFQAIYDRARRSVGEEVWLRMTPKDETQAIYEAMRAMDRDRIAKLKSVPPVWWP